MLTSFRKLMEGPGKYVFLALIVAAFGVVGVPALSNFGKGKALQVGKTGYTALEVENEFTRRLRNLQYDNDTAISREEAISQGLLQETISSLTLRALLEEEADALGLAITDKMLQDFLASDPTFQDPETGEYDPSLVTRIIAANELSVGEFRDSIRVDIYREQLNDAIRLAQPASTAYTNSLLLRQNEERDVSIAVLTLDDIPALDDNALLAYYESHPDDYQSPEYRTYTLFNLTEEEVKSRVEVSEEEIRQLYEARAASLSTPETRSFSQAQFGSMEEAESVLADIEAGTSFEEAVTAAGGTLTSFTEETENALVDDTIAEVVFAKEETGVVGPIDGLFGVVIANITSITPSTEVTFEDAREELEAVLAEEIYRSELDNIYDEIQESGDAGMSLAEAARDLGFEARTVGPVSRTGETPDGRNLELAPAIQRTAFAMAQDGFFEEASLPDGGYAFLQIEDITPAALKPYEDVATQVAIDAAAANREQALQNLVDDIRLAVSEGKSFEDAVTEAGGTAATRTLSARLLPPDLPASLVDRIFGQAAGRVLSEPGGGGASVTLAQVKEIRFLANAQADQLAERLKYQVGQDISGDLYTAYIEALQQDMGVKTDSALLAQRFGTAQ